MTSRISAVCSYIERGWPVFPCDSLKQPRTTHGFKDASLDLEKWRDHWVQHPDHAIGIATGHEVADDCRLVVVDVDRYKAGGVDEFRADCTVNGFPETYSVATGSGGVHFYFYTDAELRSSAGKLGPNVDFRGIGGYVIAATSESVTGTYAVLNDPPVARLPQWIVDRLVKRPERVSEAAEDADVSNLSEGELAAYDESARHSYEVQVKRLDRCREAQVAAETWREAYRGDPWDQTVYEVACTLLQIAQSPWNTLTETDAYDVLMGAAPRDAGFGETEILAKWNSARKTVEGKVYPVPKRAGGLFIELDGELRTPDAYFGDHGLDPVLLGQAVLELGPLAVDHTENRSIYAYRNGVWCRAAHEVMDRCEVLLGTRFRPHSVKVVEPALKSRLAREGCIVSGEPLPEWINVRNGMLHWRSGELGEHSPGHYSTVQLPVAWEPGAQCPEFDRWLKQVMADDAVEFAWEVIGYMIYSGNPFQKAVLLHGEGGNGKGTLIRVLSSLLGYDNVSQVTLQALTEDKFDVASLYGKIANLAGDIDAGYLKSTAKLKAITGEDTISAQRKYEHPFSFRCWAVPLFSANKLWKSVDTTLGYRRRWLLVPFPHTFENTPSLTSQLTTDAELSGVLAGAVAGLQRLMQRGEFALPVSSVQAKEAFDLASDQVREWLDDDPSVEMAAPGSLDDWCSSGDAYAAYRSWCEQSGHKSVSQSEFRQRLSQAGYTVKKSNVMRVYGLRINRLRNVTSLGVIPAS